MQIQSCKAKAFLQEAIPRRASNSCGHESAYLSVRSRRVQLGPPRREKYSRRTDNNALSNGYQIFCFSFFSFLLSFSCFSSFSFLSSLFLKGGRGFLYDANQFFGALQISEIIVCILYLVFLHFFVSVYVYVFAHLYFCTWLSI